MLDNHYELLEALSTVAAATCDTLRAGLSALDALKAKRVIEKESKNDA